MKFKPATQFTLIVFLGVAAIPLPAHALEMSAGESQEKESPCNSDERFFEGHCILDGELLRKIKPDYPRGAEKKGVEATVRVKGVIGKDGDVTNVYVDSCTREGFGFEEAAIRAVRRWKYQPFLVDGKVEAVSFDAVVEFELGSQADPPSKSVLRGIRDRGRELAAYDRAAWDAGDEIVRMAVDMSLITHYIPRREGKRWSVVYGQLDESAGVFRIIYEAKKGKKASVVQISENLPAVADHDYFLRAARAINLGIETHGKAQRAYNVAALPTERDNWFVYLYPAPVEDGVWPLGGDVRYLVSSDGSELLETRQLHKTIIEFVSEPEEGDEAVAGVHTHVLECIPEDTDVFGVLSRRPPAPEYIICEPFSFAVDEDGTVRFIGHSDELWGDSED